MREEGAGALFKGLTPVMLRAFPANAVSLSNLVKMENFKWYIWQMSLNQTETDCIWLPQET